MVALRINLRFPGELVKAVTLSYDDQSEQDIRLIEILDKNKMKGTFNLSSGLYSPEGKVFKEGTVCRRMTRERAIELYKNSGHEVAVHGFSHPFLTQMPIVGMTREVFVDRIGLEKDYDTDIRGMAYPFGIYSCNEDVINSLKATGLVYGRLTAATRKFELPEDWFRWNPTCKHTDAELMGLAKKFIDENANKAPKLFYLWGHSFEFEADNNWNVIEEFCEYIGNRDDIWYATNIEIYDYVQAYQRLIWTAELDRVYNPSAIPVSFQYHIIGDNGEEKRTYTIGSGETLKIPNPEV